MMLGYYDKFCYFQCDECGCLQISKYPKNLEKFYPSNYYSYSFMGSDFSKSFFKFFKFSLKKIIFKTLRFNKGSFSKVLRIFYRLFHSFFQDILLKNLSEIYLTKNSKILDVGCGVGTDISLLKEAGYNNLLGIDPYLKNEILYPNGVKIKKKEIFEVNGKWDLIMFNHSFEHLFNPLKVLKYISSLLKNGGICLIRIPIASSFAWRYYKEDWVKLDAPRHFFLPTIKTMVILSKKSNLIIKKIIYDSNESTFWGSEQYRKGIPLISQKSYSINPFCSNFTSKQIKSFKKSAIILNRQNQGDEICIYLQKSKK